MTTPLEEFVASLTPRGLAWGPARLAGFSPPEDGEVGEVEEPVKAKADEPAKVEDAAKKKKA